MATNVLFSRGSSVNFAQVVKDPNTLYFLNDTHEIYLGGEKYAFGQDISIAITGVGDTVSNVTFDSYQKLLTLVLGEAADAESIQDLLDDAIATCVKSITTDRGSAILVDATDSENPKLSLNIASGSNAGNVVLEECSDGLKASVEIPEDAVTGVKTGDKILALDNKELTSTLSITTVKEDSKTYVILKGINNAEISRFDASEFVKDGMLDSVALKWSSDGLNHRILVLTFNTDAGKEAIELDVNDLVDVYTAAVTGGLSLNDANEFSIANSVIAAVEPINSNKAPAFGETVTLKAVKYDAHGLITGTGDFTFKMPSLVGGSVGSSDKLVTLVSVAADGTVTGSSVDIATSLSASSTNSQIPTAKAVWDAVEDAKTVWESIS